MSNSLPNLDQYENVKLNTKFLNGMKMSNSIQKFWMILPKAVKPLFHLSSIIVALKWDQFLKLAPTGTAKHKKSRNIFAQIVFASTAPHNTYIEAFHITEIIYDL